jgi:TetR/AcrR family transcriptional regulator, cholesterol catabolism regulator
MAATQPPVRPLLRRRYDERQAGVVVIAAQLFARRGYQATSITELSEATGLTAGGLYHYIGNKDALLGLICDELLEPLIAQAGEILEVDGSAATHLRQVLRVWLEHIEAHQDHMLVFVQERQVMEQEPQWRRVRAQRRAFEEILERILARGEEEGVFHFDDRGLALLALLGMVNYTAQWLRPRGRLSATEIADGYADLMLGAAGRSDE